MRETKRSAMCVGLVVGLALLGLAPGCGSAKAETFEVTYYYLPG